MVSLQDLDLYLNLLLQLDKTALGSLQTGQVEIVDWTNCLKYFPFYDFLASNIIAYYGIFG